LTKSLTRKDLSTSKTLLQKTVTKDRWKDTIEEDLESDLKEHTQQKWRPKSQGKQRTLHWRSNKFPSIPKNEASAIKTKIYQQNLSNQEFLSMQHQPIASFRSQAKLQEKKYAKAL